MAYRRPQRVLITKRFRFEAAHHLPWHEGKCKWLHGHSYKLEVTVGIALDFEKYPAHGMAPDRNGVVMDFGDLKKIVTNRIINMLDHKNLNDMWSNPTAEAVAMSIFTIVSGDSGLPPGVFVERVRLWETEDSYVTVD